MFKTGVWSLAQIQKPNPMRGFLGGTRRASIALYDKIADVPGLEAATEAILLPYADSRGAYKRTYRNRFDDFDAIIIDQIAANFPFATSLNVHDLGVSDARTSCDLFSHLSVKFSSLRYVASDYESQLTLYENAGSAVAVNATGEITQIVWPPFVFNLHQIESFVLYPLNSIALSLARRAARRILASPQSTKRNVLLFCPQARQLMNEDSRFVLDEHNLLSEMPQGSFQVLRAMNVLNASYFNAEQFALIMRNFHDALVDKGLVVMGSNGDPGSNVRGGIYRKTPEGFETLFVTDQFPDAHASITNFKRI